MSSALGMQFADHHQRALMAYLAGSRTAEIHLLTPVTHIGED